MMTALDELIACFALGGQVKTIIDMELMTHVQDREKNFGLL